MNELKGDKKDESAYTSMEVTTDAYCGRENSTVSSLMMAVVRAILLLFVCQAMVPKRPLLSRLGALQMNNWLNDSVARLTRSDGIQEIRGNTPFHNCGAYLRARNTM